MNSYLLVSEFADALADKVAKYYGIEKSESYHYLGNAPGFFLFQSLLEGWIHNRKVEGWPDSMLKAPNLSPNEGMTYAQAWKVDDLVRSLYPTLASAVKGDKIARNKINAIRNIVNNELSGLRDADISDIARRKYSASRARAWDMRRLMEHIALAITPRDRTKTSILTGQVEKLDADKVKTSLPFIHAARELHNSKSTLQSLAIRLYQKQLEEEWERIKRPLEKAGIEIKMEPLEAETDTLKKDLYDVAKWHKKHRVSNEPAVLIRTFGRDGTLINVETLPVRSDSFLYRRNE